MRENVSPGAAIAAVVVVVLLVAFIGYRMFAGRAAAKTVMPAEATSMVQNQKMGMQGFFQSRGGPNGAPGATGGGGMAPSGVMMPGMMGRGGAMPMGGPPGPR